jgi:predicted alpha/beta-fold hydrolase
MPLLDSTYKRPFYLANQHIETLVPALLRKVKGITYKRQRLELADGDFLDLDWSFAPQKSANLVILSHGLEGDTYRPYIKGMAKMFNQKGWDALAWNHRGCSGEMNRLVRFYHSGATEDLRSVVNHITQTTDYQTITLIGFSLGGNMTLKFLGEESENIHSKIKKSVVFSVPLHLSSCSASLRKPSNWIYAQKFRSELKDKIRRKSKLMPDKLSAVHLSKVITLKDFDDFYTAPLHGFKDAEDYYAQASSIHFVENIQIPTLVVNAENDPFLAPECFPKPLFAKLNQVYFETPATGGHVGFAPADQNGFYWSERRAWEFVNAKGEV